MPSHLDYVLLREFQRNRQGEEAADLPIVWATTFWRQTRFARKAILIRFDPSVEVSALPETLDPEIQTPPVDPELLPITKDFFWAVVSSANSTISLQLVVALRLILHMISLSHRQQIGMKLTYSSVASFFKGFKLTPDVKASIFWDDNERMKNFFKNRLFHHIRKRKADEPKLSELELLRARVFEDKKSKPAWDAVFKHVDYALVESVFEAAVLKDFNPDLPDFRILEEPGSATCVGIDSFLTNSESPLGPACNHAAVEGSLTINLIKGLAKLRIDWQKNRLTYGTAYWGLEDTADEADFELNSVLARANKLSDLQSRMQLSKKGENIDRHAAVTNQAMQL